MLIMFTTVGDLNDTNDDYPQLTVATPTPLFLLTICLDQSTIQGLTVILTPYNPSTRKLCQMNEIMIDITCRINTGKKNSSFLNCVALMLIKFQLYSTFLLDSVICIYYNFLLGYGRIEFAHNNWHWSKTNNKNLSTFVSNPILNHFNLKTKMSFFLGSFNWPSKVIYFL